MLPCNIIGSLHSDKIVLERRLVDMETSKKPERRINTNVPVMDGSNCT